MSEQWSDEAVTRIRHELAGRKNNPFHPDNDSIRAVLDAAEAVPSSHLAGAVAIREAAEKVSGAWDWLVEFGDFDHVAEAIGEMRAALARLRAER